MILTGKEALWFRSPFLPFHHEAQSKLGLIIGDEKEHHTPQEWSDESHSVVPRECVLRIQKPKCPPQGRDKIGCDS